MMFIEKIATLVGFFIILAITIHENVSADNPVESHNDSVALRPRNFTLNKVDNVTKISFGATRKTVLILNSDPALRSGSDKKKVTSLHYQEYDDNGKILNTMWMHNLKDVAEFFRIFLDTEICYGRCKN